MGPSARNEPACMRVSPNKGESSARVINGISGLSAGLQAGRAHIGAETTVARPLERVESHAPSCPANHGQGTSWGTWGTKGT
jgi:hypothetical protein